MSNYEKRLDKEQWGKLYNKGQIEKIKSAVEQNQVACWTKELLKLSKEGDKMCEVGCGTGQSALYLQKQGRNVTALDFSEKCIELVGTVNKELNLGMEVLCVDVSKELPYKEKEFDYIYQCGLLEHFYYDDRIKILKNWCKYTKHMISMVPNAASIAYRTGKAIMEENGTWEYGLELPQYSLQSEFKQAGIYNVKEYTIGAEHALKFLPEQHYMRKALQKWLQEREQQNINDICGQGYLLVTIGDCK